MKKLTHSQLVELLAQSKGAFPVGIVSETDTGALKTGNPYGVIWKKAVGVTFTGAKYEDAVNREAGRQDGTGGFKSAGLKPWQEEIIENKVIRHKTEGTLYLRTQSTPGQRKHAHIKVLNYRGENGQFLGFDKVKPFLPKKSASKKQLAVGVGDETGTDKKQVQVRDFKFESIKKIRIGKERFELVND